MKYSEIVGSECYKIQLTSEQYYLVDVHFSGAAHHLYRWKEAKNEAHAEFHLTLHRAHLRHLMSLIHEYGDFSRAEDPTLNNMDDKEAWNPDKRPISDPEMFDDMSPDPRVPVGEHHSLDKFLTNLNPPVAAREFFRGPIQIRQEGNC